MKRFAELFVKFMNENNLWDEFTKKQSHDAEGKAIEGKYFLSSDGKLALQNVEIVLGGEKMLTTRLEIPTILARNIQSPEFKLQRKTQRQNEKAIETMAQINTQVLTPEQKAAAKAQAEALLAELDD